MLAFMLFISFDLAYTPNWSSYKSVSFLTIQTRGHLYRKFIYWDFHYHLSTSCSHLYWFSLLMNLKPYQDNEDEDTRLWINNMYTYISMYCICIFHLFEMVRLAVNYTISFNMDTLPSIDNVTTFEPILPKRSSKQSLTQI